jgi:hypothetical protein
VYRVSRAVGRADDGGRPARINSPPMPARVTTPLTRLRTLAMALENAEEFVSHGAPTFRVRKRKVFATFASSTNHHGQGRDAVWCLSTPATQELLIERHPERIFKPPYVGPSGWIGIWLDRRVSWKMVKEFLVDAHELAGRRRGR